MTKLDFNHGIVDEFTIVLSGRRKNHYGQLLNISNVSYKANLNAPNEIYFVVQKTADGVKERLWDEIIDLRLVWVKEINEYFEIQITLNEADINAKIVTGRSLCECELSQINLYQIEINTEEDISRKDYVITKFYDSNNPKGSLLHRILGKCPSYSVKYVDASLTSLQRSFSIDNKSVYSFLTGECSGQFNCLFQFDSRDRTISVYDLYTVCNDCGHRGSYNDVCPKCQSRSLHYFGEDTAILASVDNLTDEIKYETDIDSIKNCFKLEAGDDTMTAAVISCIPNGSDEIYYISTDQKRDMSDSLVSKISSYQTLYESYVGQYRETMEKLYECINKIVHYTSKMMPTIEILEVTASAEAEKLTELNLSPISLVKVDTYTSDLTVQTALINYAKVFVKSGFVKVEVDTGNFVFKGKDADGKDYGIWNGRFKITNYSDQEDIAYSRSLTITVTDDYSTFIDQKIRKNFIKDDSEDGSVYDVLSISNLENFKTALTFYCLNRLTSFHDAILGAIDVLIEGNAGSASSELYQTFYLPYYQMLLACQSEIDNRQKTIDEYQAKQNLHIARKEEIQSILNFKHYLGDALYCEFCNYKREFKYTNSNYISDGLSDDDVFQKAREFIEEAQRELVKSGEYQHTLSSNLENLLVIKEFAPVIEQFQLGNWIRLKADDNIYRLRLVSYEINFDSLQTINTTFSDVSKTADGIHDIQSILKNAASMAASYSYLEKQAASGQDASDTFEKIQAEGLNSALYAIKNSDSEEITYDKHGLLARSYDDISDSYLDEQLKITHNIFAYTIDNWKSVRCALGKQRYTLNGIKYTGYGLNADFCIASTIIGANINNGNGTFSVDPSGNVKSSSIAITGGSFNINNRFIVDANGNVTLPNNATIAWSNVTGTESVAFKKDIPTNEYITTISKNAITTSFIKTLNLTVGNEIAMGSNATISWNNVTNKSDVANISNIPTNISQLTNDSGFQDRSQVTEITKDTITTGYINALHIKAGSVDAENITGSKISGKEIRGGRINSANIYFYFTPDDIAADKDSKNFCGAIINRTDGAHADLCIYGNDSITLSTLLSTTGDGTGKLGGLIKFERVAQFEQSITIGRNNKSGFGYADFYYRDALNGCIFANRDDLCIEARNNKDIAINADTGSGTIRYYGQLVQNSSERYKDNIAAISEERADKILSLLPKEYTYKATGKHGFGFIAEHTQDILPQIVVFDPQGRPDGVSYVELIPIAIKKMQMQETEINQLKEEINSLKIMIQGENIYE